MRNKVVVIDSAAMDQTSILHTVDWQKFNCEVVGQAADGSSGQKVISEVRPDILISDIQMPGENGLYLADWMLAHMPRAKTILTTYSRSFEIARQAIHLKVHAMVIKPIQNEELLQAIRSASEQLDTRNSEAHSFLKPSDPADPPVFSMNLTDFRKDAQDTRHMSIMHELERFDGMLGTAGLDELNDYVGRLFVRIAANGDRSFVVIRGMLHHLCLAAVKYYFRITRDEYVLDKSIDQIIGEMNNISNLKKALAYLMSLIAYIKEKLSKENKEYSPVIKEMLDYIHKHYKTNISLTTIADQFGLSTSYVSRTIRAATGINFTELVTKLRIESAKRLLREGKYKVNEVGEKVGYKEYSYFYHAFKRMEGVAPKEFIQNEK